jgi:hypothetical protein
MVLVDGEWCLDFNLLDSLTQKTIPMIKSTTPTTGDGRMMASVSGPPKTCPKAANIVKITPTANSPMP